jgi:hypothetical protein
MPALLPEPAAPERLEREIDAFDKVNRQLWDVVINECGEYRTAPAIAKAELLAEDGTLERLKMRTAEATRPATRDEIATHVAALIACYPGNRDPLYGRMLCEDVGAAQPSIGALEAACRHLRRTVKFAPAIAEMVEALTEAEKRLKNAAYWIEHLPDQLTKARELLERRRERTPEEIEEARGRRITPTPPPVVEKSADLPLSDGNPIEQALRSMQQNFASASVLHRTARARG